MWRVAVSLRLPVGRRSESARLVSNLAWTNCCRLGKVTSSAVLADRRRLLSISSASRTVSNGAQGSGNNHDGEHDAFSMFKTYCNEDGQVQITKFLNDLRAAGFLLTDRRLAESMRCCREARDKNNGLMSLSDFKSCVSDNLEVIQKALLRKVVIPDFERFKEIVLELFEEVKGNSEGEVATYIPQLAQMNPDYWAVSLCTVDGQRLSLGDRNVPFCLESASNCIMYPLVLDELGSEKVHSFIGKEPSGRSYNALLVDKDDIPHNPMVNAGAMVLCSLLKSELDTAAKFHWLMTEYGKLAAGEFVGFCNATFQSERQTADRNYALGHFLRDRNAFGNPNIDLMKELEFYFQVCSMQITASSGAVMAACLATGGVNPLTGEKVLGASAVRNSLSLMLSCGMNENSGVFAFQVGLPAKSGVSGCILLVVPNVMGICLFSPRLNENGNSIRGMQFAKGLVDRFSFHHYDSLLQTDGRWDPRRKRLSTEEHWIVSMLFSVSRGDLASLRRFVARGTNPSAVDYDRRTALHVAAACGHVPIIKYLLSTNRVDAHFKDRWGKTALDSAIELGRKEAVDVLKAHMAQPTYQQ